MTDLDATRARRYLLGQSDDPAGDAFEESMFRDDGTLELAEAAEDALIEDYLTGRLPAGDRVRFEQHYLAAAHHRIRVETVRRLLSAAPVRSRWRSFLVPLAAAAALILAAGAWWFHDSSRPAPESTEVRRSAPASHDRNLPAPAVRMFATSLSPITLRSADAGSALVIPAGTDIVSLRLLGDGERPTTAGARVILRTVAGDTVWQGDAMVSDLPAGAIARVDVPASVFHPDDYIVDLKTGPVERELYRYVLRVRAKP